MKYFNVSALVCALSAAALISCNSDVTDQQSSDPGASAPVFVSRLIFTGDANVGGTVKVEIKDSYIEGVLDGNSDWLGNTATAPFGTPLAAYTSPVKITISNLTYHDQTVAEITCSEDTNNQMSMAYEGPSGTYYEGTDGKLYLYTGTILGVLQYSEQGLADAITKASLAVDGFFLVNCKDSDGNDYEVSLYPSNDILSHGITTTFDVASGAIEQGIVRVHKVAEGHVPYVDMVL
jgi:hypothetical protein